MAQNNSPDSGLEPIHAPLLFVQTIFKGSFTKNTLKIKDFMPHLYFMIGLPYQLVGHITTSSFIKLWEDGLDLFETYPPLGIFTCYKQGQMHQATFELSQPTEVPGGLIFKTKTITGDCMKQFKCASLFIDILHHYQKVQGNDALSQAAHNATIAQQQANLIAQAATSQGVDLLYSLDTAQTGQDMKPIFGDG